MAIEIRGIPIDRSLQAHAEKTLTAILGRLAVKPVGAQVTFFDDNGPKGGLAVRCALTVRLPYRPHLRAEGTAENARLAFDAGFGKLERELERYRERERERKRYPKKYYAADQLMKAGEEGARAPGRASRATPGRTRRRPS